MTFTYCDARHDGTPVHCCLCQRSDAHANSHLCACGHEWGLDWNQLTYDQQRRFLGLPSKRLLDLKAEWGRGQPTWTIEIGEPQETRP